MTDEWTIKDKTVLITGANTGIGRATAIELARLGAKRVVLACRNLEQGQEVVDEILKTTSAQSAVYHMDLSSIASVKAFCSKFLENETELHVLINNAGIFGPGKLTKSVDGFELTFATNHLGHFCLTTRLLDLLVKSGPSRIVTVSANKLAFWACRPGFHIDDVNFGKNPKKYGSSTAYNYTKLANVLFTRHLHKKLTESGRSHVTTYSLHPGVVGTDIARNYHWLLQKIFKFFGKSPEQGCRNSVYCATQPGIEHLSSSYFMDCHPVDPGQTATDETMADKLWQLSEKLVSESGK